MTGEVAGERISGGGLEKIVRKLVAYFVPAAMDVQLETRIREEEKTMALGNENVLGHVTYLG